MSAGASVQNEVPKVDGLRLGLTVHLLMTMREAAALGLQSFYQTACQSSDAEVARGCEVVLRGRFPPATDMMDHIFGGPNTHSADKADADVLTHPAAEGGWPVS